MSSFEKAGLNLRQQPCAYQQTQWQLLGAHSWRRCVSFDGSRVSAGVGPKNPIVKSDFWSGSVFPPTGRGEIDHSMLLYEVGGYEKQDVLNIHKWEVNGTPGTCVAIVAHTCVR